MEFFFKERYNSSMITERDNVAGFSHLLKIYYKHQRK